LCQSDCCSFPSPPTYHHYHHHHHHHHYLISLSRIAIFVLKPFSNHIAKTYCFIIIFIVVIIFMIITDISNAVCFFGTQISCYCLQCVVHVNILVRDVLVSKVCLSFFLFILTFTSKLSSQCLGFSFPFLFGIVLTVISCCLFIFVIVHWTAQSAHN
jgi:hypothetical protein